MDKLGTLNRRHEELVKRVDELEARLINTHRACSTAAGLLIISVFSPDPPAGTRGDWFPSHPLSVKSSWEPGVRCRRKHYRVFETISSVKLFSVGLCYSLIANVIFGSQQKQQ